MVSVAPPAGSVFVSAMAPYRRICRTAGSWRRSSTRTEADTNLASGSARSGSASCRPPDTVSATIGVTYRDAASMSARSLTPATTPSPRRNVPMAARSSAASDCCTPKVASRTMYDPTGRREGRLLADSRSVSSERVATVENVADVRLYTPQNPASTEVERIASPVRLVTPPAPPTQ